MKQKIILNSAQLNYMLPRILLGVSMAAFACLLAFGVTSPTKAQEAQTTAQEKQMTFAKPEEAAEALIAAAEKFDEPALMRILGPNSYDIIHSGELVYDKEVATEFAGLARK